MSTVYDGNRGGIHRIVCMIACVSACDVEKVPNTNISLDHNVGFVYQVHSRPHRGSASMKLLLFTVCSNGWRFYTCRLLNRSIHQFVLLLFQKHYMLTRKNPIVLHTRFMHACVCHCVHVRACHCACIRACRCVCISEDSIVIWLSQWMSMDGLLQLSSFTLLLMLPLPIHAAWSMLLPVNASAVGGDGCHWKQEWRLRDYASVRDSLGCVCG